MILRGMESLETSILIDDFLNLIRQVTVTCRISYVAKYYIFVKLTFSQKNYI